MAIESGRTLIGVLESDDKSVQLNQGESSCRDHQGKDYWTYQLIISNEDANSSNP